MILPEIIRVLSSLFDPIRFQGQKAAVRGSQSELRLRVAPATYVKTFSNSLKMYNHKGEIKAMLDRAQNVADRLTGKSKEAAKKAIEAIEKEVAKH